MAITLLVLLFGIIVLVAVILTLIGSVRIFQKAGQPGWGVFVPIYILWLMAKIGDRSGWAVIVPYIIVLYINAHIGMTEGDGVILPTLQFLAYSVFFGIMIYIYIGWARNFNKDAVLVVLLTILPPVGYIMLGFGDAQFKNNQANNTLGQNNNQQSPTPPDYQQNNQTPQGNQTQPVATPQEENQPPQPPSNQTPQQPQPQQPQPQPPANTPTDSQNQQPPANPNQ